MKERIIRNPDFRNYPAKSLIDRPRLVGSETSEPPQIDVVQGSAPEQGQKYGILN